jgi:riboflavin synthase alpha subunit
MAERREKVVFADQRLTVSAVESVELRICKTDHGHFMTGHLKPTAVIVKESDRTYALDMDAWTNK